MNPDEAPLGRNDATVRRDHINFVHLREWGCGEITDGSRDGQRGIYLELAHPQKGDAELMLERFLITTQDAARLRQFLNTLELPEVVEEDDTPEEPLEAEEP